MIWSRGAFSTVETKAPRGQRAYAIGDVHGRLDLLENLLDQIEADVASRRSSRTSIVFLGDLIDRGPQSAQVVERLRTYRPAFAKTFFVMGNHEEVFLRILNGENGLIDQWLGFGGADTAQSYGVDPVLLGRGCEDSAVRRLREAVPDEHRRFLEGFVDSVTFGSYLFVHAGLRPGVALADQSRRDMRWIREPFLEDDSDHGCVVVHGHSIRDDVDSRRNRIGIDTGAWFSGCLSALGLEAGERWLLQTGDRQAEPGSPQAVNALETQ